MENKVDVVVNYYGKPFQTIATLYSLLFYNSEFINRIFLVVEKNQPKFSNVQIVRKVIPNIEIFIPTSHEFICQSVNYNDKDERHKIRYQYAIE